MKVTDFRKKIRSLLEKHEKVARDQTNGMGQHMFFHHSTIWSEELEKVYPAQGKNFETGCGINGYTGIQELAVVLFLEYKVKTIVVYNLQQNPAHIQKYEIDDSDKMTCTTVRAGTPDIPTPRIEEYKDTLSAIFMSDHWWLIRPHELNR